MAILAIRNEANTSIFKEGVGLITLGASTINASLTVRDATCWINTRLIITCQTIATSTVQASIGVAFVTITTILSCASRAISIA